MATPTHNVSRVHQAITLGGRRASDRLRTPRETAETMVDEIGRNFERSTAPEELERGDVTDVTTTCVELAIVVLDTGKLPVADGMEIFRDAATRWARDGVPLRRIQHALHEGFAIGFRMIAGSADNEECATVLDCSLLIFKLLDAVNEAVSEAYLAEYRTAAQQHHHHDVALLNALLAGQSEAYTIADRIGVTLAPTYDIVALHFPAHPDELDRRGDAGLIAARKLRRIQAALTALDTAGAALSLLSSTGGTVLLPHTADFDIEELVQAMERAGQIQVTATTGSADVTAIAGVAAHLYELLSLVRRLQYSPNTYRTADLVFEFQVTRPGIGRQHLSRLLEPLHDSPDLMLTLQAFVDSDANRKKAAKLLMVHPNTVDYRLKRVEQLTGIDPIRPSGLQRLHAALIAEQLEARKGSISATGTPG